MIKYPKLKVDLSKCSDTWDIEGKVHGQMKSRCMYKRIRKEFTMAVQKCSTWDEVLSVTAQWVTIICLPNKGQKHNEATTNLSPAHDPAGADEK